jgi:tetratricopeptide (TPR) repeat protein
LAQHEEHPEAEAEQHRRHSGGTDAVPSELLDPVHRRNDPGRREPHAEQADPSGIAVPVLGEQQRRGDQSAAETLIDRALTDFEALDDRWGLAAAFSVRANLSHLRGDLEALRRDAERSAELFAATGDSWGRLQSVEPLAALAEMTGDYRRAAQLHGDGLRMAEDLGLWPDAAYRLAGLGRVATLTGDHLPTREFHERARRIAVEHSFKPAELHAEVGLGMGARREQRFDTAETHLLRALEWYRRTEFAPGRALVLAELGFIAELRGDAPTALRLHREGHRAALDTADPRALALALEGLSGALALAGNPEQAARLLGAADAARTSVATPLPPAERGDVDRITAAARRALGESAFRAAFELGRTHGA